VFKNPLCSHGRAITPPGEGTSLIVPVICCVECRLRLLRKLRVAGAGRVAWAVAVWRRLRGEAVASWVALEAG